MSLVVGCPTPPEAPSITRLKASVDPNTLVRFGDKVKMTCPKGLRLDTGEPDDVPEVEVTCKTDGTGWEYPPAWPNCVDSRGTALTY